LINDIKNKFLKKYIYYFNIFINKKKLKKHPLSLLLPPHRLAAADYSFVFGKPCPLLLAGMNFLLI